MYSVSSFDFVMMLNGVIVDVGAIQRLQVVSWKEAEARSVLAALKKGLKNRFVRLCISLDIRGVITRSQNGQAHRLAKFYYSIRRDVGWKWALKYPLTGG